MLKRAGSILLAYAAAMIAGWACVSICILLSVGDLPQAPEFQSSEPVLKFIYSFLPFFIGSIIIINVYLWPFIVLAIGLLEFKRVRPVAIYAVLGGLIMAICPVWMLLWSADTDIVSQLMRITGPQSRELLPLGLVLGGAGFVGGATYRLIRKSTGDFGRAASVSVTRIDVVP